MPLSAISCRLFFSCILGAAVLALAGALTAEHVFGLEPCILCLYERVPWVVAGLLSACWLGVPLARRSPMPGVLLVTAAFSAGAFLASYHVGVEQGWWAFQGCTGELPGPLQLADLMEGLDRPVRPSCNVVQWTLFGVSFAGYNALASLFMMGLGMFVFLSGMFPVSRQKGE